MNVFRRNLLEQIERGDRAFASVDSSLSSLREFDRTAQALLDFEAAGLLEMAHRERENTTGENYFVFMTAAHLTAAGRRILATARADAENEKEV